MMHSGVVCTLFRFENPKKLMLKNAFKLPFNLESKVTHKLATL